MKITCGVFTSTQLPWLVSDSTNSDLQRQYFSSEEASIGRHSPLGGHWPSMSHGNFIGTLSRHSSFFTLGTDCVESHLHLLLLQLESSPRLYVHCAS